MPSSLAVPAEIEKKSPTRLFSQLSNPTIPLDEVEHASFSIVEKAEMEQIRKLLFQSRWNISAVSKEIKMARSTLISET